jgi:hypothetical protein
MQKPKLLYIGSSGLGENIFAEPAMRRFCEDYDVYFCLKNQFYHFLSKYDFIKNVVWYYTEEDIQQFAKSNGCEYYTSHFEGIINSYSFLGLKAIEHKVINHCLSYMENVLNRFDYLTENTRYAPLTTCKPDGVKRIVLYIGSKEPLRRLSCDTFNLIIKNLQHHFGQSYELICLVDNFTEFKKLEGVVYLVNQHDQKSADNIINLFSSGVSLLIGPDSGFMHLALGYNTPLLFLETRERYEHVIPKAYKNTCDVYRKINSKCSNDCRARILLEQHGEDYLEHIPNLRGYVFSKGYPQKLLCYRINPCACLDFNQQDINSIIDLSKSILARNSAP